MGNSSKKLEKTHKEHNHLRLRNAKQHFIKSKSYIKANFPVSSKEDFAQWEKDLKRPPAGTARHAFVPNQLKSKSGMCGSSASAQAHYPPFWYLLSDQIKNRKKSNNEVDEKQIWQIIYALSETAKQYHKSNIKTGDIRPSNILLDQTGDIKLVTQHSWPEQETNYVKTLRNGQKTYLSPEEVKDVDLGRNKQSTNIQDGDAFSLGLTALDCALLEESYNMYPQKGEIDLSLLDSKRNQLRNSNFSPQLKATILSMTDPNPNNRSVPGQIFDWLKMNQVEIYNNHPFTPSNSAPYGVSMFMDKSRRKSNINYSQYNQNQKPKNSQISQNYQTYQQRPISNLTQTYSRMVYTTQNRPNNYQQGHMTYTPSSQYNYQPTQQHKNEIQQYIARNKPAPKIQTRYLPPSQQINNGRQSTFTRQEYPYSNNNRPSLRDIYISPEIVSRSSYTDNIYIPKSQQKQPKRPTYDFGNNFTSNYQNNYRTSNNSENRNEQQNSNFYNEPASFVDRLKSKVNNPNNQEQIPDNRQKTQTVIVNRGSKPEVMTVAVEEDYPEMQKMSNWKIDQHNKAPISNLQNSPSAPQVQEDLPYKPKMSYWSGDNNNQGSNRRSNFNIQNSHIPVIHEASQEDSRLRSVGRDTPPKSNMQPIQSAYQSEQQLYKISFFNNSRKLPNSNNNNQQRIRSNSGLPAVASGYQPSPVVQDNNQGQKRVMVMKKKNGPHDSQNQEQIRQKMNAQTTAIYRND